MAEEALKDFLRKQARSLDSLLELTPAKNMFGEDVSDQWQRKKQTPEQKKAARMAKLDPANWKSAKDVYDERSAEAARKRKREDQGEDEGEGEASEIVQEQDQPAKKRKVKEAKAKPMPTEKITEVSDPTQIQNKNFKKKMKKRAHRAEKNKQVQEEEDVSEVQPQSQEAGEGSIDVEMPQDDLKKGLEKRVRQGKKAIPDEKSETMKKSLSSIKQEKKSSVSARGNPQKSDDNVEQGPSSSIEDEDTTNIGAEVGAEDEDEDMEDAASTATSSEGIPEILSPPQDSAASSVSSVLPQPIAQVAKPTPKVNNQVTNASNSTPPLDVQTDADRQAARQRLQEQISQFRSQRKADDRPIRSRAELLAQRRQKEQERKAAKKEQRRKEKEEEAERQDEEMAKRFSPGGSGSLLASPRSPMIEDGGSNAFTFGRIAFEDGTQFDPTKGSAEAIKTRKGPQDPATALKAAQARQARIAGLDDDKKQKIEDQSMWLSARKRAHGERVKDDTSLLKKALKRQDKQKQRSGKEWDERVEGVRSSQEHKQKKRTENLQKRKDEKGGSKSSKKKVKRPGFEGSFRGRTGKSKK